MRDKFSVYFKQLASEWPRFYRLNHYYHQNLQKLARFLIPEDASVIEFGCRRGELLASLPNLEKVGIEASEAMILVAKKRHPQIKFVYSQYEKFKVRQKFDYILLPNTIQYLDDVQLFIRKLNRVCHEETRVVVIYFNFFWKIFLDLAEKLGWRLPQPREPNWLSIEDIQNLFYLESFDQVKRGRKFLIPYRLPLISDFINQYLAPLPVFNNFCFINYAVFRKVPCRKERTVSVIIPARNEEGNIPQTLAKIPKMGRQTEVIFVEDHSKDQTVAKIKEEIGRYQGPLKASFYRNRQSPGKAHTVRLGFEKAKNEVLMILDADLTVAPQDLVKFYKALVEGKGDLIIGSRLVYPMEKQAMRFLNYLGNKFFGNVFSFLLDQRLKDTLCGTKVILKDVYQKIAKNRHYFGDFDLWGDFDLIFGATKLNLKITEIPVRYKERKHGQTNMKRFLHGWLLLKMTFVAAKKIKFF
jgi:ubiquinone/menaquinone biosynthesis C-methylase UbiE